MSKSQKKSKGDHGNNPNKYAAVVYVSTFREAPKRAITTILKLSRYFGSVHLVSETVTLNSNMYRMWQQHKKQLRAKGMALVHHTQLQVHRVRQPILIHFPATSQLLEATFKQLDQRIKRIPVTNQPRHAIMPMTDLAPCGFSVWYIFLTLVLCLDWWRQVFAWFTFHTADHIRAEEILKVSELIFATCALTRMFRGIGASSFIAIIRPDAARAVGLFRGFGVKRTEGTGRPSFTPRAMRSVVPRRASRDSSTFCIA